jgi:sec-independent protein translocase protein TatA
MFTGILQPTHLIVILIVALVFLGPKRLPDAGRALGQGLKEFKSSISGVHDEAAPSLVSSPAVHEEDSPPAETPH